jgi:hypothetical protein
LYTGDARGQISCWNLKIIIFQISQQELKMADVKRKATQEQHYSIDMLNAMVSLSNVNPLWTIDAHDNAVSSLHLVKEPHCLISAARTAVVNMWDPLSGQSMGVLDSAKTLNDHAQRNNHDETHEAPEEETGGGSGRGLTGLLSASTTAAPTPTPSDSALSHMESAPGWAFKVDVRPREHRARQLARDTLDALNTEDDSVMVAKHDVTYTPFRLLDTRPPKAIKADGEEGAGQDSGSEDGGLESYDDMNGINSITERLSQLEYAETAQEQEIAERNRSVIGYMDPADRKKSMQKYLETRFQKRVTLNRGNIQRTEEEAALLTYELDDAYSKMAAKYGSQYKAGQRTTKIGNKSLSKQYKAKQRLIVEKKIEAANARRAASRGAAMISPRLVVDTEPPPAPLSPEYEEPDTPGKLPGREGERTNASMVSSKFRRQSQLIRLKRAQSEGVLPAITQPQAVVGTPISSSSSHSSHSSSSSSAAAAAADTNKGSNPKRERKLLSHAASQPSLAPLHVRPIVEDEEKGDFPPAFTPLSAHAEEADEEQEGGKPLPLLDNAESMAHSLPVLPGVAPMGKLELVKQASFRFERKTKAKMRDATLSAAEQLELVMRKFKGMDSTLAKRQPKKINKLAYA